MYLFLVSMASVPKKCSYYKENSAKKFYHFIEKFRFFSNDNAKFKMQVEVGTLIIIMFIILMIPTMITMRIPTPSTPPTTQLSQSTTSLTTKQTIPTTSATPREIIQLGSRS